MVSDCVRLAGTLGRAEAASERDHKQTFLAYILFIYDCLCIHSQSFSDALLYAKVQYSICLRSSNAAVSMWYDHRAGSLNGS
jgi:hypothetical protein